MQSSLEKTRERSQLSEERLYGVVARMVRFTMHEIIHPLGKFFDAQSEMAKIPSLCVWTGKPSHAKAQSMSAVEQIAKNFEAEKKRDDEKDRSWPKDKKD